MLYEPANEILLLIAKGTDYLSKQSVRSFTVCAHRIVVDESLDQNWTSGDSELLCKFLEDL